MFIGALFTIVKIWKQPKCPSTEDWIRKMWAYCHLKQYRWTLTTYAKKTNQTAKDK